MKNFASLTIFALLFVLRSMPQTVSDAGISKSDPGFSISLETHGKSVRLDSPIEIDIIVRNNTNKDIYWRSVVGKDAQYKAFMFSLKRDGREQEGTYFYRRLTGHQRVDDPNEVEHGSSVVLPYPPGLMFKMSIDLARLYQLNRTGRYELQVSRSENNGTTLVTSEPLTLTIVP